MADIKRQVALKVWISDLTSGSYVQESGMLPNYVLTKDGKKISRVNLLGVVVSSNDQTNLLSFVLDDSSATITVRAFEENTAWSVELGSVVLIIGRPRQYGNEIYVLPEIVKKVDDNKWIDLRKLELGVKQDLVVEQTIDEQSLNKEVYNLIKSMDDGAGVPVDAIVDKIASAEKVVDGLLSRGEIFEVSPGKIKVLD